HLGPRAFSAISGEIVMVAAFSCLNAHFSGFKPQFFRLIDGQEEEKREALSARLNRFAIVSQNDFDMIPGSPIAYWASERMRQCFQDGIQLGDVAEAKIGMRTGDNERFLRRWHEVSVPKVGFGFANAVEARNSRRKW